VALTQSGSFSLLRPYQTMMILLLEYYYLDIEKRLHSTVIAEPGNMTSYVLNIIPLLLNNRNLCTAILWG